MSGPIVVGIDPSYTGFAIVAISARMKKPCERVTIATAPKDFESRQDRQDKIRRGMLDFLQHFDPVPALIAVEGYAFGAKAAREVLGELGGLTRWTLWSQGYRFIDVQPTTLKKYVLGKGTGQKNLMLREVHRKWGYVADDDNDADAYALARFAGDFLAQRSESFQKLSKNVVVVEPSIARIRGR